MGRAVLGQDYVSRDCETIADGIAIRVPTQFAVEAVRCVADQILFVSDINIRRAMMLIERETGDVVEPAGAAGLAGLIACAGEWAGRRVAIPICGGNRDH